MKRYIAMVVVLALALVPLLSVPVYAGESDPNLWFPEGNQDFLLVFNNVTITYDSSSQIYTLDGVVSSGGTFELNTIDLPTSGSYTMSIDYVSGDVNRTIYGDSFRVYITPGFNCGVDGPVSGYRTGDLSNSGSSVLRFGLVSTAVYDNFCFRVQLEAGSLSAWKPWVDPSDPGTDPSESGSESESESESESGSESESESESGSESEPEPGDGDDDLNLWEVVEEDYLPPGYVSPFLSTAFDRESELFFYVPSKDVYLHIGFNGELWIDEGQSGYSLRFTAPSSVVVRAYPCNGRSVFSYIDGQELTITVPSSSFNWQISTDTYGNQNGTYHTA